MNEKTKNILIGILIVGIISMTVVYAALSQTLNISGSAKVQNRDASWNIHFTHITSGSEVAVTSGTYATVASNTISLDGTSTTATLPEVTFKAPGDEVTFLIDVINEGDVTGYINIINDINIPTATGIGMSNEDLEFFTSQIQTSFTYANNNAIELNNSIAKNETKHLKIVLKLNTELTRLPESEIRFSNITASLVYGQDEVSAPAPTPSVTPKEVGDTVPIGTQSFHVLWSNESKTALIADYNLDITVSNVNQIVQSDSNSGNTTSFSQSVYWASGYEYMPSYLHDENGNPAYSSGNPYPYIYDSNSNLYQYVEGYVNNLKTNYNAPNTITGRIPSYEEIYIASGNLSSNIPSWIQGNYWTGSFLAVYVSYVVKGSSISYSDPGYTHITGIKPVIIFNTSDLQ